jgi:hypothetical protein
MTGLVIQVALTDTLESSVEELDSSTAAIARTRTTDTGAGRYGEQRINESCKKKCLGLFF